MNAERLLKLADHLESGALGHATFSFKVLSIGTRGPNGCGTAGCALGEMPFLAPLSWNFELDDITGGVKYFSPVLRGDELGAAGSACKWFGITCEEYEDIFIAGDVAPWNDFVLGDDATRFDVARGIRNFVAWRAAEDQPVEELEAVLA